MNSRATIVVLAALLLAAITPAQDTTDPDSIPAELYGVARMITVDPHPELGFHWPYLLYIPIQSITDTLPLPILVLPNNTGTGNDTFDIHIEVATDLLMDFRPVANELRTPMLIPIFPRPFEHWHLYTQALNRAVMLTKIDSLARLDRQLLAMIDHARGLLQEQGRATTPDILLFGYSASGQFADRFTVLHPDRVRAAAIGSPGGWPIAPLTHYQGKLLRYPVGIGDLETLTGERFNREAYQQTPILLFMGDEDTNDAVVFEDAFGPDDKETIFHLFGHTPIARWSSVLTVHAQAGCDCRFKLYEDVGHTITPNMLEDIVAFLKSHR